MSSSTVSDCIALSTCPQTSPPWTTPGSVRSIALGLGLCAVGFGSLPALGQDADDDLDNRGVFFRVGGTLRAGVKAQIRDSTPPATFGPGDYSDGYVKTDKGGSANSTWNWGFNNQSQLSQDRLTLSKTENAPRVGNLSDLSDSPLFGGELMGGLEMTRTRLWKRDVRFGFELGYGYSTFSVKDTATATSAATYTTAVYDTTGILPPSTPSYSGTFDGPGPIINLTPIQSSSVNAVGNATLSASLNADLHTLKIGPWMEVPLTKHFVAGVSFGLASIYATADLEFTEATAYAGGAIPSMPISATRVSRSDWRPGAYLQLRLAYEFNRHFGVFVGTDFQYNRDMVFGGGGREATLQFEATYGATLGASFRF